MSNAASRGSGSGSYSYSYSLPVISLGIIHAVGVQCMYGLVYRNGYLIALRNLYTEGPFVLPGSTNSILTRLTGIKLLDSLLTLANILFANVLDGSTPQSSLYAFHFAGQLVPIFSLLLIEGSRKGNRGRVCSWSVVWGCLMQGLGYGFVMPIYCVTHLLSSPATHMPPSKQETSLQVDVSFTKLPLAIGFGYILPSVLMAAPLNWLPANMPSNMIHQWFTGLWQGAPVWIILFHLAFKRGDTVQQHSTEATSMTERRKQQEEVDQACKFAFGCAAFAQLCTFSILAFKNFLPVSPGTQAVLTFSEVFVPPRPWVVKPMPNMAVGIMNFFQYDQYIGSLAGLFWATWLHRRVSVAETPFAAWALRMLKLYSGGIVGGPAAVFMSIIQDRDRFLLERSTRFSS